ncbi:MAG: UDP-3-O-(3-hydroxymyristoyl)glucosamine N-acyltransferase [Pseudomonadota bacterium]
MIDPRFFNLSPGVSAARAAQIAGADLSGDAASVEVGSVATLEEAGPRDVVFVEDAQYLDALKTSGAGACILSKGLAEAAETRAALLLSDRPKAAFARLAAHLIASKPLPGADEPAVAPDAVIGQGARIGCGAVIGAGAEIGEGATIDPHAVIGPGVVLGPGAHVGAGATVTHAVAGAAFRCLAGARIGEAGFGFAQTPTGLVRVPQLGRVIMADGVEIGANSTIDRGALGDTVLGDGVKIDNLVQIGHNVRIGKYCVFAAHVGVSGSCTIGDFVMFGGKAGIADHINIGSGAQIAAGAGVMRDVPPGETWGGYPARPIKMWLRETAAMKRLVKTKRSEKP